MNKRHILIIFGILAVFAILIFLLWPRPSNRFSWQPNYKAENKQPYGAFIIAELLKNYFPDKGFEILRDSVNGNLPEDSLLHANYIFIGEALYMDSVDMEALLAFVENGNTAFISSLTIPKDLMDYLYYDECHYEEWSDYNIFQDTMVQLNLYDPKLHTKNNFYYKYVYRNKPRVYDWSHFNNDYFCEGDLEPLGDLNDTLIHFARINYGDGVFYLHTVPITFTNYHLLDSNSLEYAHRVFSYLPEGKIYWDEYSKTFEALGRYRNDPWSRSLSKESPLQYILSQPPLTWAWYLLIAIGLLFLLFRTKRRQRIIPVLEPNANTSLEFVSTIGRLYFMQNSHKKLALQKMKLFLNFVRERYHLRGQELDEEFIQKLIAKSEVPRELIDKIWLMHRNITNSSMMTENTLIDFHQLMDQFYKTCK
ncbi:MAG: DUF4350 domain-containing protein [Saprospiraceae bacterium]|nr:DUF4350 domain-containing protein [Saprospiraceae bacterium]